MATRHPLPYAYARAHTVLLDGGPGRFYYFRRLEENPAGNEPKAAVLYANDR